MIRLPILLSLLFSSLSVSAQSMKLTGQFFWGQTSFEIKALDGINYRWVSSDLGSNAVISGNWVDRIKSSNWWMSAVSLQPTNTGSTNGVWFDSTHYLTNNGLPINTNVSFGFIVKVIDDGRVSGLTRPSLLTTTTNGVANLQGVYFTFRDPFSQDYPLTWGRRQTEQFFNDNSRPLTNVWTDIVFTQAMTNSSQLGNITMWTNGVQCVEFDGLDLSKSWAGISGTTANTNNFPQYLMFNVLNQSSAFAYLRELWIWGNSKNTLLSYATIQAFHSYRTNLYGP